MLSTKFNAPQQTIERSRNDEIPWSTTRQSSDLQGTYRFLAS
jgi:hypothetical protein